MGYLLIILMTFISCSKQEAEKVAVENSDELIIHDTGLTKVQGMIKTGGGTPSGLAVWLLDLTAGKRIVSALNQAGEWSFPIGAFVIGHDYAFHIFDADSVRLAIYDFSPNSGLQGAVRYAGGYGMDLGVINLPLDSFGLIDISFLVLNPPRTEISGGFSLNPLKTGSISELTLPDFINSDQSGFGHSLICNIPTDVLNGFYLREEKPSVYQLALNKFSGFFIKLVPVSGVFFKQLWAAIPVNWMMSARKKTDLFSSYYSAVPWESTKRLLVAQAGIIEGDFVLPKLPCLGCGMDYYLGRESVAKDVLVTQGIARRIFMIPKLVGLSQATTVFPIDYTSTSLENGLTRPFKLVSSVHDVELLIHRPILETGEVATDQRIIMIKLIYSQSADEVLPEATDFLPPYQSSFQTTSMGWDVSKNILSFNVPVGLSSDQLKIPKEVLLPSRNDIDNLRFEIVYESSTSRSGTMVLFSR